MISASKLLRGAANFFYISFQKGIDLHLKSLCDFWCNEVFVLYEIVFWENEILIALRVHTEYVVRLFIMYTTSLECVGRRGCLFKVAALDGLSFNAGHQKQPKFVGVLGISIDRQNITCRETCEF